MIADVQNSVESGVEGFVLSISREATIKAPGYACVGRDEKASVGCS